MALIKSALELAMERSTGLSVDKEELRKKELIIQGRLFASKALSEEDFDAEKECKAQEKKLSKEEYSVWKEGVQEAFLSRIVLVYDNDIPIEITQAGEALTKLGGGRKVDELVYRCINTIKNFTERFQQLKDAIAQQLGPALKQRAAQLAAQTGISAKYSMEKDPAYLKVLSENLEPIKRECQQELDQLKLELKAAI